MCKHLLSLHFLKISFANKGLDAINLGNSLHHKLKISLFL